MTHTNTKNLHKHAAPILVVAVFSFLVGAFFANGMNNSTAFAAVFATRFTATVADGSKPAAADPQKGLIGSDFTPAPKASTATESTSVKDAGNFVSSTAAHNGAWDTSLPAPVAPVTKK